MRKTRNPTLHTLAVVALTASLSGCGNSKPPAASITVAPKATPEMHAAGQWLLGNWDGSVEIDQNSINRTKAITDAHVDGIRAARMQFSFQSGNQVAMSVSVPTPKGPAARNAMAVWTVTQVQGRQVTLQIKQERQPVEEVVISRADVNTFTMPASEHFGQVRFVRIR